MENKPSLNCCSCGTMPQLRTYSGQSPYEQVYEVRCPNCGNHTFAMEYNDSEKALERAVNEWNHTTCRNQFIEHIRTDKKTNMEYWDLFDALAETHVKSVISLSVKPLVLPEMMTMDDVVLEVGKMLTDHLVNCLEQQYGAEFPYVDENY